MWRPRTSPLAPIVLLALLGLVSSCRRVAPLPAEALTDLHSLEQFRAAFDAASDKPRLLVLLSPT